MEWLRHLSQAVDYIEDNLTGSISYDDAAKIACCSSYYFQRIFSYVLGISVSEYIRRRRMTAAAFELQSSDDKVLDISLKYGYDSPTAFNRAFQSVHGVPPSAARISGTVLKTYPRINFSIKVIGSESMSYRIETKEPIRIVGMRTNLREDIDENYKIVPDFWDETLKNDMLSEIGRLSNQTPYGLLGASVYLNPNEIYYYIAAATDKAVPNGMTEFEIPSATWVIFNCDGHYPNSIQAVYKRFFTEWLPFSGYECAELPDIEVYPVSKEKLKSGHSEIWIAIKKSNMEE